MPEKEPIFWRLIDEKVISSEGRLFCRKQSRSRSPTPPGLLTNGPADDVADCHETSVASAGKIVVDKMSWYAWRRRVHFTVARQRAAAASTCLRFGSTATRCAPALLLDAATASTCRPLVPRGARTARQCPCRAL